MQHLTPLCLLLTQPLSLTTALSGRQRREERSGGAAQGGGAAERADRKLDGDASDSARRVQLEMPLLHAQACTAGRRSEDPKELVRVVDGRRNIMWAECAEYPQCGRR